ncbi:hypothetical protein RRG08_009110 [Elysia crispata]|uniref:Apple domain-containing protein n=1 Tax=Elysia crispata TaxID=231223 RepID=A0AAE0ZYQ7_9GAST|nr:hypothetical protein RRG08_009110 [Elysia crispata]
MFVKVTDGAMFDFHVTDMLLNCTQQETLCRDIGYDGLAVISSPEAYKYALKLTRSALKGHIFIGAHYQPESGTTMWDDNTRPRSDTPFSAVGSTSDPGNPYARTNMFKQITMGGGASENVGLCGNRELQTSVRTVLSVSQVLSYLECAVICGMVHECRAAEFNSDLLTCTVFGEYTSLGDISKPQIVTYQRVTF